jgi:asparagine synthase (glutamine-hydrolysing)
MCGICGFNWEDKTLIKRMSKVMHHRGPDSQGFHTDKNISLAHNRLSIIDLSKNASQPMYNHDKSICIIFNGEIYNHKSLREKINSKYEFISNSDTEVILHLYEEYGERCLDYLNGMFAFSIWDSNKRQLFIARDRIGIKPLYYSYSNHKFIFASEIKAILEHPIERKVNCDALSDFITFSYIPYPRTLFQNINKLPPSHYLLLKNNKLTIKKYYTLDFKIQKTSFASAKDSLSSKFQESVEMQLMSDVPLGAYLSGGMDSSSIVAMMSNILDKPVTTFSVGFDSDEVINELYYAKQVADKLNTNHNEIHVTSEDAIKILPKIVYHLDEPISNPASIPLYFMSQAAKKKMTVVLTGNGGDELFAGYRQHKVLSMVNKFYNVAPKLFSNSISRSLATAINYTVPKNTKLKKYSSFASKFIKTLHDPTLSYTTLQYNNFSPDDKDKLLRHAYKTNTQIISSSFATTHHILNKLLLIDLKMLLPENYLMVDDKINMANSVESRVPFLDHKLVEFASTLLPKYKLHNLTPKYILKKAMKPLLPKEVITRKKYGFTPPLTQWINTSLKSEAQSLLLDNKEIGKHFNTNFLKNILEDASSKHYNKILPLLMFSHWHKTFIES